MHYFELYRNNFLETSNVTCDNFLDPFISKGTLGFIHFTPFVDQICASGIIKSSGGGLGYGVYGVPYNFATGLIHNLGIYIAEHEINIYYPGYSCDTYNCFVVLFENAFYNNITTCNYLTFGSDYKDAIGLETKSNSTPIIEKELTILHRFVSSIASFNYCVNNSILLPSLYFEAFQEIFLYTYKGHKFQNQLPTGASKEYIFSLVPGLRKHFSTKLFCPELYTVEALLNKECVPLGIDYAELIYHRMLAMLTQYYFNGNITKIFKQIPTRVFIENVLYRESVVKNIVYKKIGHNIANSISFKSYLQTYQIPKGEMLINPFMLQGVNYSVYKGIYRSKKINSLSLVNVKISDDGINDTIAIMRKK